MQTIKRVLADDTVDNNSYFFWNVYAPLMHYILSTIERHKIEAEATMKPPELQVHVRAVKEGFQLKSNRRRMAYDLSPQRQPGYRRAGEIFYEFSFRQRYLCALA